MHAHTPSQNLWFGRNVHLWHFPWPKCPWPKCPTFLLPDTLPTALRGPVNCWRHRIHDTQLTTDIQRSLTPWANGSGELKIKSETWQSTATLINFFSALRPPKFEWTLLLKNRCGSGGFYFSFLFRLSDAIFFLKIGVPFL